ncbi:D-glycero-beta-D-manno-heptose-1,7-bisphosphate 7-phosphatase, partial [Pseudomonas syringae]
GAGGQGPGDGWPGRGPRPGMLQAMARHDTVDRKGLGVVGDSKGDLQAAQAVDSQPVLVMTGKGRKTMEGGVPAGTLIVDDLAAVAAELIHNSAH